MSLYETCVRRPVFATMLIMSLVVLGLASYRELGVDLFPKVDLPTVTVTTRLEGESQVYATFVLDKDINVAANEVREKVSAIASQFPPGTDSSSIEKFDPDASPVMAIVVSGKRSAREVTEIADKKIKRQLETVKDVGAISLIGDRKREIQVFVSPDRLAAYNLSIQQIKEAVRRQNIEIPGGRITWQNREQGIRTMGRIEKVNDFNELIVADYKGAPVRLRDVGYVRDGEEEPRTLSRLDDNRRTFIIG